MGRTFDTCDDARPERLDSQQVLEMFDIREVHEGLAVRLCCDRATRVDLRQLADLAERIFVLSTQCRFVEMASLDQYFHSRLLHLSGSGMLLRLADYYQTLGTFSHVRESGTVRSEHLAVLKAIEQGRPDAAEGLMRSHIRAARRVVEQELAIADALAAKHSVQIKSVGVPEHAARGHRSRSL